RFPTRARCGCRTTNLIITSAATTRRQCILRRYQQSSFPAAHRCISGFSSGVPCIRTSTSQPNTASTTAGLNTSTNKAIPGGSMNLRLLRLMIICVTCLATLNTILSAQTRPEAIVPRLDRIPSVAQRHLAVLGDRMRVSGRELTIYTGDVIDSTGNRSPAQVIHQLPGLVRLSGFKPGQAVVSFDGERALGVISNDDDLLLETFVMDMPEGMLAS